HISSSHANARFVADFQTIDGLELVRTMNVRLEDETESSVIDVPEANFAFKVVSQLEYQAPTEEVRHNVGGWVVQVKDPSGESTSAFLSDVSETGAGILSSVSYQRGEILSVRIESMARGLDLEAEVRYSVRSKIAPDMFKTGLKLCEFGRLEGAVWRNFLKAA
ncbi:MAG: PilZ domain-containing protein, partial [Chlorobia bacterium]|nr:PilZ domain-containing protein [Fimbriimonadaceae bacterium]